MQQESELSHKDLVRKAQQWLSGTKRCTVVMSDLRTQNTETPDGLGFHGTGGGSVLVECKASRADFQADHRKIFRKYEYMGMGNERYFMVPKGLVKPEEVPDPWGLIEVYPGKLMRSSITKKALPVEKVNKVAEVIVLVSAIRRLEISTAVFVRQED